MDEKDFYKILGVERNASDDDIKKAYRKLAQQFHPDKHAGEKAAEEKFKLINAAYECLKTPEKRAQYDRFGYAGAGPGPGFRPDAGFGADFQDLFSEVFSDFFGGRQRGPSRGADLRYDVELTFEEAAFGTDKKINIPKNAVCGQCQGTGAKAGTSRTQCAACKGRGEVRFQQGFLSISRPCPACGGQGSVIKDPCPGCGGAGRVRATNTLTVKFPPGVETGSRLRIAGEGDFGERGALAGDLYIVISVKPHAIFTRENDDVICEMPIAFTQAALGAEVEVPTIEGPVTLKIPPGTQSGKVFRLKGKGIASLQTGRRGDEQVIIRVETPAKLSKRQREILEEFASLSGEDTMPLRKNFFSKVKDIFE
ncbi:MAG: molecular chaperone DnaJ [Deltaproteobacteria bacterium]|nr:molecular chaperone DnaJ [Deltaproteobacteria bacterium]